MNQLEKFCIIAVLVYCAFILFISAGAGGGQAAIFFGIVGIVGIAGIYAFATLVKHLGANTNVPPADAQRTYLPPPPSNICPSCHHALTFIEQYKAWYCFTCKEYK
jgi:hypothetical protein